MMLHMPLLNMEDVFHKKIALLEALRIQQQEIASNALLRPNMSLRAMINVLHSQTAQQVTGEIHQITNVKFAQVL